jgi:hypothetical protein
MVSKTMESPGAIRGFPRSTLQIAHSCHLLAEVSTFVMPGNDALGTLP